MKIKNMVQISSLAFVLGAVASFASFDAVLASVKTDVVQKVVQTVGLSDTIKAITAINDLHGASKVDLVVKTGSQVAEGLNKIPTTVVRTIGEYQQVAVHPDRLDDVVTALNVVKQTGATPGDVEIGAKIIGQNADTIKNVATVLATNTSTIQAVATTGDSAVTSILNNLPSFSF